MSAEITVVGNLVADPEVKFSNSGKAYCQFTVAVGSRKKDSDGNWIDGDVSYFDATAFEGIAENLADSLTKGTRVVVTGSQTMRSYEDKEGNKRTAYGITVDEVAPSLRWAVARVTKANKGGGGAPKAQSSFDEEPF